MRPTSGGSAGSIGEFALEEINSDFVEQKILECLESIFDKKY